MAEEAGLVYYGSWKKDTYNIVAQCVFNSFVIDINNCQDQYTQSL